MAPQRKRRVLIVNDDPAQLRMAGRLIERGGHESILCETAAEALKVVQSGDALDLIVADLYMPKIDGWRLCRLLRSPAFPATNHTPILVLSATFAGIDAEEITRQIGANAFLSAPYDPRDLMHVTEKLLEGQAERRLPSVLVGEGSEAQRNEIVRAFVAKGYEVLEAADGGSLAEQVTQHHPEVVVLDNRLGDATAADLLPQLRTPGPDRVIVVMIEGPTAELAIDLLQAGADAYVPMPPDTGELLDVVTESLRQRSFLRVQGVLEERTQELRASEARYRAIVQDQTELIFRFLPDGTLTFANDAFWRYFEKQPEGLVGENVAPLVLDEDQDKIADHLASLTQERSVATTEHRVLDAKGEARWLQRTDRGVFDPNGHLIEYQCVARDVTDRNRTEEALKGSLKQITQAKQEWESTADSLPQFVCLLDAQGQTVRANRTIEHWGLGQVKDLKRRSVHELLHPHCKDMSCHMLTSWPHAWEQVKQGGSAGYDAEDEVLGRYLSVQLRPIAGQRTGKPEERASFAVVTVEDVTDRKRAEQAIQKERALLAQRVQERTAELSAANAELAIAARHKDEFLASMSHEFRTPLNTILGMSEALQEGVYGPCDERQLKSLRSIEESGRHLLALINDILDLAKIGAGKSELELGPVSVESACQASLRLVREAANKKQLKISSTFDSAVEMILADERRLKQILTNLLSNAVKFTPEGGEIGLEVVGDSETRVVHFIVWDTGIGIADKDMGQLFNAFVQLDSKLSRQYTGTGLGLSLAYRLTEMHQGGVSVESEVGKGSRFTVTLPWRVPSEQVALLRERPAALRKARHRALVVEPEDAPSPQLVRCLEQLDAGVVFLPRVNDTLAKVKATRPDIIILGVPLADLRRSDVLRQLNEEPQVRDVPVIVLSPRQEQIGESELGTARQLAGTVSDGELREVLRSILVTKEREPEPSGVGFADQRAPSKAMVILLAEDNEDNINTISDYLTAKGYHVPVARNGGDALERAKETNPDLILMDIQMPGMDGLEATRRIRSEESLANVPIIALTALAMPGDRERCLKAGANDYMSKPVHLKRLLEVIEVQTTRASRVAKPIAQ